MIEDDFAVERKRMVTDQIAARGIQRCPYFGSHEYGAPPSVRSCRRSRLGVC